MKLETVAYICPL